MIHRLGGTPAEGSGAWGFWAKMVLGSANIMSNEQVLKALQAGEQSGAEDYQEALQNAELSSDVHALIETQLKPAQQAHIGTLDRLLKTASA